MKSLSLLSLIYVENPSVHPCVKSCFLFPIGQKVTFVSPFGKNNVTGQTGHPVTFTWKFTGASVKEIKWGLKKDGSYQIDELLVSLDQSGVDQVPHESVPDAYKGRVSGTRTGVSSSYQASFTLSNITKDDERFYACQLIPTSVDQGPITDFVKLVLVGKYLALKSLIVKCYPLNKDGRFYM